ARAAATLASSLLAVTALAACGNSDSGGSTASSTASGKPILIGMINQSAGSLAYKGYEDGLKPAAGYINAQGGVDGHPIKVDICATDATPTATQGCAQKFVASKPLFVTTGIDNNMSAAYPLLDAAKIPVIGGIPVNAADFA